jgi:ankyrin repeat protein
MISINQSTECLKNQVVELVYNAVVILCGREQASHDHAPPAVVVRDDQEDDKSGDGSVVASVSEWRAQLWQLVQSTITIRDIETVVLRNHGAQNKLPPAQLERSKLYDVEIRTAPALFARYKRVFNSAESPFLTTTASPPRHYCWTMVSDMGVTKQVDSADTLAHEHLLPLLQESLQAADISTCVRVAPRSGFVCVVTKELERRLLALCLVPCPYCPLRIYQEGRNSTHMALSSSGQGVVPNESESCAAPSSPSSLLGQSLWWHLQQQHQQQHHLATAMAMQHDPATALVLYAPSQSTATVARDAAIDAAADTTTTAPIPYTNDHATANEPIYHSTSLSTKRLLQTDSPPWSYVKSGNLAALQDFLASSSPRWDCATRTDSHGATVLHWAAGQGHVDVVQFLVEHTGCQIDTPQRGHRSFGGRTALHWAARHGHVEIVQYLLHDALDTLGSDGLQRRVEAMTQDGTTAFGWAAWQGHVSVLRLLHERYRANVQTTNQFGCNAALWASQGPSSARNNADNGSSNDRDTLMVLQWLERVGCSLYAVNHSGHGVLHKAAQRGRRDLCEWFIEQRLFATKDSVNDDQKENGNRDESPSAPQSHSNVPSSIKQSLPPLFHLIGPDKEGCTPSDLAGMEHHTELAMYLARQEMALVAAATAPSLTSLKQYEAEVWPGWLTPMSSASEIRTAQQWWMWEPGAGVYRMRSVLSTTSHAAAMASVVEPMESHCNIRS